MLTQTSKNSKTLGSADACPLDYETWGTFAREVRASAATFYTRLKTSVDDLVEFGGKFLRVKNLLNRGFFLHWDRDLEWSGRIADRRTDVGWKVWRGMKLGRLEACAEPVRR